MSSKRANKRPSRKLLERRRRSRRESAVEERLRATLRRLASSCRNPATLIELYYWSTEPELAAVLRNFINLPTDVRHALRSFLAITTQHPETIQVYVDRDGHVTLYSDVLTDAMNESSSLNLRDKAIDVIH